MASGLYLMGVVAVHPSVTSSRPFFSQMAETSALVLETRPVIGTPRC
jgi:hypothetical protein